jgi:hypothetical protein
VSLAGLHFVSARGLWSSQVKFDMKCLFRHFGHCEFCWENVRGAGRSTPNTISLSLYVAPGTTQGCGRPSGGRGGLKSSYLPYKYR